MSATVIVGGGPAGAAAAIGLCRAGRRPLLLEREARAAEKVCGEFLGEDAARILARLGLDLASLGGVPLTRALFGAGRSEAELRLPFPAWGLPRAILDAALLDAARWAGAEIRTGASVSGAERAGGGWLVRLSSGEALTAPQLVLATGKHELRGLRRPTRGGSVGAKLVLAGDAPEAAVVLLACAGGYAGLQRRTGGGANLCAALDLPSAQAAGILRSADAFMAHVARGSAMAERLLARLRPVPDRPIVVAGVPYGFIHRGGGPLRVGDQAAVIPSFCGDGVAMALGSGLDAAHAIATARRAEEQHAIWAGSVSGGMRLARLLAALTRHAPRLLVAGVALAPEIAGWAARRTRLGIRDPRDAQLAEAREARRA